MKWREIGSRLRGGDEGWKAQSRRWLRDYFRADHAPEWDRFAGWPKWQARLVLAVTLALVVGAAIVPIHSRIRHVIHASNGKIIRPVSRAPTSSYRKHDADLALYDRVIARIQHGEPYYDFIVDELRRSHYPVTPGFAVRLPTLAYIEAGLGSTGTTILAALLFLAVLLAWWRRLGAEPGGRTHRWPALALLVWLTARAVSPYYLVMHELWAGLLIALSIGLHRPGRRWVGALLAAALALAIRELALPFVVLMGAMAFWRRDWREGLGWTVVVAGFLVFLLLHFQLVAPHVLPTDRPSASWLALRGLSGWLSDAILASNLRYFDRHVAAVLVVVSLLGWAGWRSALGLLGFLFFAGYAALFMIAGRWENFYWGWITAPAMMVGLAFVPRTVVSLVRAAVPGAASLRRSALRVPWRSGKPEG